VVGSNSEDGALQASIDEVIEAVRSGRQLNSWDLDRLALEWPSPVDGEWYADLISLRELRQAYEDGFIDESPVNLDSLADNDIVALVRRIAHSGLLQHDPDSTRLYGTGISHTDGETWLLASYFALEFVPIGVFRSVDDAKAACVTMGYLVGNDGEDARWLDAMSDDLILQFFRNDAE
jgi:hypothetical protein